MSRRLASSSLRASSSPPGVRRYGLSLVEVLLALVIVSVLSTLAWPNLGEPLRSARRSDAMAALSQTSLALEQWRAAQPTFTDNVGSVDGLGLTSLAHSRSFVTPAGHHRIAVLVDETSAAWRYVVTATPIAPHRDPACASMSIIAERGVLRRTATPTADGTSSIASRATTCWRW